MNYRTENGTLTPDEYVELVKSVGWKVASTISLDSVERALQATTMVLVIRDENGKAIAAGRAFSDDLTMTFIPDILVHPVYQKKGLGRTIVEAIKDRFGHTIFYFGGQPDKELFFEKLGFKKGMTSFTGRFASNQFFD